MAAVDGAGGGMTGSGGHVRTTVPVARNVFWVMMTLLAWVLFQGLRAKTAVPAGRWSHTPFDLVFLVLLPALVAFAFTRLFLVLTQSARGTLNVYAVLSSPQAWLFWLGLGLGLIGHGVRIAAHALYRALPEAFLEGAYAQKVAFLDGRIGYLLLGLGFFLVSLAVIWQGLGAGQRLTGPERFLFVLGSLATYGFVIVYIGVAGQLVIPTIAASVVLSGASLWILPPSEVTYDPIGALITPGSFLAGLTLIIWTIVVGGQPTWP